MQERRQPADLEFRAAIDQHIGRAQWDDETRARIDEVRIFRRLSQSRDLDFVVANFARERCEIGQGGDDFELCVSGKRQCA